MAQLIIAILMTIVVVVFSISNSHHVELSFVVGKPVEVRLVFLLMSTFFIGMVAPIFYQLFQRLSISQKIEREKKMQQAIRQVDRDLVG